MHINLHMQRVQYVHVRFFQHFIHVHSMHVWQSHIGVKHYSVAYFYYVTVFEVLLRRCITTYRVCMNPTFNESSTLLYFEQG